MGQFDYGHVCSCCCFKTLHRPGLPGLLIERRNGVDITRGVIASKTFIEAITWFGPEFKARCTEKKLPATSVVARTTRYERVLGRELAVLFWALEDATTQEEATPICRAWSKLRPEDRWTLYHFVAAEGGLADQRDTPWRRAIRAALDGGKDYTPRTHKIQEAVE